MSQQTMPTRSDEPRPPEFGPDPRRAAVEAVLATLRPAMRADGGDVELVDVGAEGAVRVRLKGACLDCPSAPLTMRLGIERTLRERLPWVTSVGRVDHGDACPAAGVDVPVPTSSKERTMNARSRLAIIGRPLHALSLTLAATLAVITGCDRQPSAPTTTTGGTAGSPASAPATLKTVRLGIQSSASMALPMIAKDTGAFERNGLDVKIQEFTAGKFALQAYFGGSLDLVVSGEVPVALATLSGNKVTTIAQVVESTQNECRIVALKDDGAAGPVEPKAYFAAKRRRLATSFGGGPEFFTYEFLRTHGIPADSVEVVSQQPPEMVPALTNKSVDAISIFDPFCYLAERQLGDRVVSFRTGPDHYSQFYILSGSASLLASRPEVAHAFVRSLVEAEKFVQSDPAESKRIVAKYTRLDPAVVDAIWGNFVFRVSLTNKLVETWDREAQWAKDTKKVPADTAKPDFRAIIDRRFVDAIQR